MDMDHQSSVNEAYIVKEVKISVLSLYVKNQKFVVIRDNEIDDQGNNKNWVD